MTRLRKYGSPPFNVAVLHGGPGAAGGMEPVARELSKCLGVLEPIQNGKSVDAQVEELKQTIEENADGPVVLIGHSWGAWLGFIFAARYGALVKKLVLISAGPFEEQYVRLISENRLKRLCPEEQTEYKKRIEMLKDPGLPEKDKHLSRLGALAGKADCFEVGADVLPSTPADTLTSNSGEIYAAVWPEAARLRKSGELLRLGASIMCPVLAIQGDCDSHPAEGVREPLTKVIKDFRMTVLEKCGHSPWLERHAAREFYGIVEEQIRFA
ncbi:MAG: alpha/beta hydrolase [Fibrobacterota bacterium]